MVSAVILCGGSSTRMNGADKMCLELGGLPIWEYTVKVFHECLAIDEIIIVTSEHLSRKVHFCGEKYKKVKAVVTGGTTRQKSAFAGLAACSSRSDWIAVHDGARPFVTGDLIERVLADAQKYGAATPAVPVKDTIKVRGQDGCVSYTPNREDLFACQTPQIFAMSQYRTAAAKAQEENRDYTDDCQMIEACGGTIYLSEGNYINRKITTPDDYLWATMQIRGEK